MKSNSNYSPAIPSAAAKTDWRSQHEVADDYAAEQSLFYSALRQHGAKANVINFKIRSLRQHAVPLNEIEEMGYMPDKGIMLFLRFGHILIEGRNLDELYEKLCDHRVTMIRDYCDNPDALFATDVLRVAKIHYESDNLQRLEW